MLVNSGCTLDTFCMTQCVFEEMDYLNSQHVQEILNCYYSVAVSNVEAEGKI